MSKIHVMATANMQGISRGEVRPVSSENVWVRDNLRSGLLVQVTRDGDPVPAATVDQVEPAAADPSAPDPALFDSAPSEDRGDDVPVSEGDQDDEDETDAVAPPDVP